MSCSRRHSVGVRPLQRRKASAKTLGGALHRLSRSWSAPWPGGGAGCAGAWRGPPQPHLCWGCRAAGGCAILPWFGTRESVAETRSVSRSFAWRSASGSRVPSAALRQHGVDAILAEISRERSGRAQRRICPSAVCARHAPPGRTAPCVSWSSIRTPIGRAVGNPGAARHHPILTPACAGQPRRCRCSSAPARPAAPVRLASSSSPPI